MSTSDVCKKALVTYYEGIDVFTKQNQWKRTAKIKHPSGGILRTFECKSHDIVAHVWAEDDSEDADEMRVWEGGTLLYARFDSKDGDPFFMFAPETAWEREKCLPDQHCGHIIQLAYNIPEWVLDDEACENMFMLPPDKMDDAEKALQAAGLIRGPKVMERV